jgi:hypothetical protein
MFNLLRGKPPLEAREKAWVETRLHCLTDYWGVEQLLNAKTILPTEEHFPPLATDEAETPQQLAQQVIHHFPIAATDVQVQLGDGQPQASGANCQSGSCSVPTDHQDSRTLVATIAQAVSRALLVQRGHVPAEDRDLDRLAELMSVFVGFGVFAANTADQRRLLPARMVSYGQALCAWMREDLHPAWAAYLEPDAAAVFRSSLKYLRKTGDSLIQTSTVRRRRGALSVNELMLQLRSGSPSVKIATLWEIADKNAAAAEALPLVEECLDSSNSDLRAVAAETLGSLGDAASPAVRRLAECLEDRHENVRASAAAALGRLCPQDEVVLSELAAAVQETDRRVVRSAAWALAQYGPNAEASLPQVLAAMRAALVECNDPTARLLLDTVRAIVADPEPCVLEYFDEQDADLRHAAVDLLREPRQEGR